LALPKAKTGDFIKYHTAFLGFCHNWKLDWQYYHSQLIPKGYPRTSKAPQGAPFFPSGQALIWRPGRVPGNYRALSQKLAANNPIFGAPIQGGPKKGAPKNGE